MRWQYLVATYYPGARHPWDLKDVRTKDENDGLDEIGALGWELVSARVMSPSPATKYYFKRPVTRPAEPR